MSSDSQATPVSPAALWTGRIISALMGLLLLASGVAKLVMPSVDPDGFEQGFTAIGWPTSLALTLAILEITSVLFYMIPRTAILGAILLTGYLGGAIATHVRIFEPVFMHVIFGVLIWGGLYLREPRLRAILPWRT